MEIHNIGADTIIFSFKNEVEKLLNFDMEPWNLTNVVGVERFLK